MPAKKKRKSIATPRANDRFPEHLALLKDLFSLLSKIGLSKEEISCATQEALAAIQSSTRAETLGILSLKDGNEVAAADALHRWHRDKKFLSRRAVPRALPLFGVKASIESMIRIDHPDIDARGVASELLRTSQLQRIATNKYIPVSITLLAPALTPMTIMHFIHQLRTLMWSFKGNIDAGHEGRMIQRSATVRRFPVEDIPAFRDLSRQQGAQAVHILNDWMEARQKINDSRKKKQPTTEVGFHVFAYAERAASDKRTPRSLKGRPKLRK